MLFAEISAETGVSLGAIVLSVVALVDTISNRITKRQETRDKAEADRLAAQDKAEAERLLMLDKLQFDEKFRTIESQHKMCEQNTTVLNIEVADTKKQLAACQQQHTESANDRDEIKKRLEVVELRTSPS